ncbi:MAG TPA: sigma-54 dependent transcriptional regulator [Bacteroidales bacterium]|nr:sigma-54 dependent transcriptional regulator [Bacteroidales bacterium]
MDSERNESILIIDDDRDVLFTAGLTFKRIFERVDLLDSPSRLVQLMEKNRYSAIILDMNFTRGVTSGNEGLQLIEKIKGFDSSVPVLATTAYGEINLAITAMKAGAEDFILKPWNNLQLVNSVLKVLGKKRAEKQGKERNSKTSGTRPRAQNYPEIIAKSPAMKQVLETVRNVAPTDANILINGENGTGKELIAWTLHALSQRKGSPFVQVDLGAIPETLFESELFGHTKGAFTDAKEQRSGRFEAADGGTIFLDEIGNLSMQLQAKLLTAIQKKEIIRVGSNDPVRVDVRIISATNMPLSEMTESFKFRQDLFYRLNTIEIQVPPLREREGDIRLLSDFYLNNFSEQYQKKAQLSGEAYKKLLAYPWPGNVRELAHAIERAVILDQKGVIDSGDLILKARALAGNDRLYTEVSVEDFERKAIREALVRNSGNLSKASEELGIARSTLYRKIAQFGLEDLS